MAVQRFVAQETVIFMVGGANDAPGFQIVIEGGHLKIVPLPGWNPEGLAEFGAALRVVENAARIKNPEFSNAILNAAAPVIQEGIAQLAGGKAKTVVIAQSAAAVNG